MSLLGSARSNGRHVLAVAIIAFLLQLTSCFEEAKRATNDSLLWGPYKPGLYFGVQPKIPRSLTAGLLWAGVESYQIQNQFRHTCEQGKGTAGYGWHEYDARTGGKHVVHDVENNIDFITDFAKIDGGEHGGSWGTRVKGELRAGVGHDVKTTVIFYVTLDNSVGSLSIKNEEDPFGYEGSIMLEGSGGGLGRFSLEITDGPSTNQHPIEDYEGIEEKPLDRTIVHGITLKEEVAWQAKAIAFQSMKEEVDKFVEKHGSEAQPPPERVFTIPNTMSKSPSMYMIQKVFRGPFEFDILFSSASYGKTLTSHDLTDAIQKTKDEFSTRFEKVFKLKSPFDDAKYKPFARAMFSNLLGGVGYFHGQHIVDRSNAQAYDEENEGFWEEVKAAREVAEKKFEGPKELFSAVPSRPFFPRGFLWDEGFHLLPILDWDVGMALEILKTWFNTMDEDGWIPREQILGPEARSRVPAEFQTQYPNIANPPTLFLVIETFLDKVDAGNLAKPEADAFQTFLKSHYSLLRRHYNWYRRTQKGDLQTYDRDAFSTKEAYRWRGCTMTHCLASGFDDYPRAQPPHPGELHLDLMSWIGLLAKSMKRIATRLEVTADVAEFSKHETAILRNLDDLHWSEKNKMYCDATIDEFEENVFACHKGYVTLLPFLTGAIPLDSPKLGLMLDLIGNRDELWSDHGIRSLSTKDERYGLGENYWRGPIWINMNYLILQRLQTVAQSKGPSQERARKLYVALRRNLVETIYKSWKDTGFAWEQYNPETGEGQRIQHFTGWTSLVVNIMTMPDLGSGSPDHGEL